MYLFTLILSIAWILWCVIQFGFALYFYRIANTQSGVPPENEATQPLNGRAAILLAVRGSDPSFGDCLQSLINQDYPDFEIHVVLDSSTDPAWDTIRTVESHLPEHISLQAHLMAQPLSTCGLKCSALTHGYAQIESDPDYLVLVDSDVVVHQAWLSELIRPLSDPKVGVVTGNQWFDPNTPSNAASMVRSLWNAGAIVPTVMFRNPWAGSLAMRTADVDRSGLIEIWKRSIVDDGPIRTAFEPLGLETRFVPSLVMVNRESCTFAYVLKYVRRMLTWSRIYESTFINTVVHAAITASLLLGLFVTLAVGIFIPGGWLVSGVALGALLIGAILNSAGYLVVRSPIAASYQQRNESLSKITVRRWLMTVALTPVTQCVYAISVVGALTARTVSWREARYQVSGNDECRLLEYKPFLNAETDSSII